MEIREDKVTDQRVIDLIEDHMEQMEKHSPPSAQHHLEVKDYKDSKLTVWTAWEDNDLLGVGALKELSSNHGELKSIKTHPDHLRKGVAQLLVGFIIKQAVRRGYTRVSLETGAQEAFEPAISFYKSIGFEECGPFGDYVEDPASIFMTQKI